MILISHRGNTQGRIEPLENTIEYILDAVKKGYDCEIDVWRMDGNWFLGHDQPEQQIPEDTLQNKHFWCHAKNIEAFIKLKEIGIHTFWHQEDRYTLTSRGYIWQYPSLHPKEDTICVMPECMYAYFF